MPDLNLSQLARAAQAGDRAARDLLFSRAARLVYARAYRAVGDFEAASDIARFYLVLYPRGAADEAASEAEVTPQRAREIVTFLEEPRLPLRVQTSYLAPKRAARICVPSRLMHRGDPPDRPSVTIGPRALLPRAERSTCVQVASPSMELGRM